MKKIYTLILAVSSLAATAQTTNTFPASGNVGIGTTSPLSKLDVLGGITASDNSSINGVSFTLEDIYYKRIRADGYNLRISTGSADAYLLMPYTSTANARFYNLGLSVDNSVAIGTTDPQGYKLAVNGKARAHEIKVETANWPDYVFAKDYQLPTLQETEKHIKDKGHLPGIPSAAEVKANGIDLGEMNAKLLQKIEELTLHLIEMKKENERQSKELNKQRELINQLIKQ